MSDFNRGSTGAGRRRSLGLMPGESTGEGTPGNVIPRGTTLASIRRGQALLRMLNDRLPDGQEFSRGSTAGSRRRNFSLMAMLEEAAPTTGVKLLTATTPIPPGGSYTSVSWDSEVYDFEGWWSSGSTLTAPSTGNFLVEYTFDVTQSTPSTMTAKVVVALADADTQSFSAGTTPLTRSVTVAMTVGDTVTIDMRAPPDGLDIVTGTLTITPA